MSSQSIKVVFVVAQLSQFLAKGLYTVAEAAMYAHVSSTLASRWFFGSEGRATIHREVDQGDRWLSFLDFIQLLAVRSIRQQKKVPLKAIRQAIELAEREYGIAHPFARKHTIYVLDPNQDGEERIELDCPRLILRVVDSGNEDRWVDAAGKFRGHPNIPPIIESYLHDIGYDAGGLAERYTALRDEGVEIEMRRGVAFGVPKLSQHRITVWDIWEMVRSEGSIPAAAMALQLTDAEVRVACRYVEYIKPAA
jgi:uncharacterized protein (DUF433 family)